MKALKLRFAVLVLGALGLFSIASHAEYSLEEMQAYRQTGQCPPNLSTYNMPLYTCNQYMVTPYNTGKREFKQPEWNNCNNEYRRAQGIINQFNLLVQSCRNRFRR